MEETAKEIALCCQQNEPEEADFVDLFTVGDEDRETILSFHSSAILRNKVPDLFAEDPFELSDDDTEFILPALSSIEFAHREKPPDPREVICSNFGSSKSEDVEAEDVEAGGE